MKTDFLRNTILCSAILLISACNNEKQYLKYALEQAGDNRHQLERVLEHYSNDKEKLNAAEYLISNMPAHYSYSTNEIDEYYSIALDILHRDMPAEKQRDTLRTISESRFSHLGSNIISDTKIITADYLIYSIDHAFIQWKERDWAKHLTFNEFCEWLLPYKVAELQSFDYWRDTLSLHFSDSLKKVPKSDFKRNSIYGAIDIVRNEIHYDLPPRVLWEDRGCIKLLSAETLAAMRFGSCLDYVTMGTMTFRSLGLPSVVDCIPMWGRNKEGHSWFTFLSDNGIETPTMNSLIVPAGLGFYPYERIPKIFRQTYSINRERVMYKNSAKYAYPFNVCEKDVTEKYCKTSDITLELLPYADIKDQYAHIAMVSHSPGGPEWNILDFGKIRRGKAHFKNMGRNMLYIALGFNGDMLVPISNPFILHTNGRIEYVNGPGEKTVSMELRRKYYESYNVVDMRRRILGAEIQCANRSDFSDAVTLFTIDTTAIPYKIPLQTDKPYRYWRYLSAGGTYGSIAELKFFDETGSSITGTPIACDSAKADAIASAFDDNLLSNFETEQPDGNWVGMDMKRAVRISAVSISPRSDDNDICPGCEYELFCWDGKRWKSLGYRKPEGNTLYYDNLPCNCLLWLRNYTRGTNERPFIINQNREIVWW